MILLFNLYVVEFKCLTNNNKKVNDPPEIKFKLCIDSKLHEMMRIRDAPTWRVPGWGFLTCLPAN